jgi:LysR family transcriptional regulator, hydrogen peroxide-inducible genes activator
MLSLLQLEYIVAVAQHRHFAKAAETCFVTQPTLSMQIQKAEEELNALIFDRSRQPISLTDVGAVLVEQAKLVLREHQRMIDMVKDFRNDIGGELSIGIIPTVAPYLLPLFAGDFLRSFPQVQLRIKELTTAQISKALLNDELDLAILATPLLENYILEMPLFYEEIMVYSQPQHRFSQWSSIPIEELSKEKIWLLSQGNCFRNQIINVCNLGENNNPSLNYESGSLESLRRLVDKEGGITLLPELAIEAKNEQIHSLNSPVPLREISLVYARHFAKHKLLKSVANFIQKNIPAHLLNSQRGQVVEWK